MPSMLDGNILPMYLHSNLYIAQIIFRKEWMIIPS